ncbi:MAG: phosphoribosylglycinamide formyltransferase [Synergistaceae bacterium]|nr:phosphoribosylglycinamide formyltransferase [Synergistaceae bacterium]
MIRIAVLCSGGGTNLQALIDAWRSGTFVNGEIALVLASRPQIFALERAAANDIPAVIVNRKDYPNPDEYDEAMLTQLKSHNIDLVVMAGFLSILGSKVLAAYEDRIINVHPSLIPSFCGKGFYGLRVHKAALDCGVKVTGATVHMVNHVVDGGRILLQKAVKVLPDDTPESLQQRVMEEAEWEILPEAVAMFCRGEGVLQ